MTDVKMADAGSKTILEKKPEQSEAEKDLYIRMKELENELAMLQIQENYLKDEQRHLKSEYVRSKEEVSTTSKTNDINLSVNFSAYRSREFNQFTWVQATSLR